MCSGTAHPSQKSGLLVNFKQIEPFQEDPQILDAHLKAFIPPLVAAYLAAIQLPATNVPKKDYLSLPQAICQILNLFCKVRGEKVIKGFFNNEPRYLELILGELEARSASQTEDDGLSLHQPVLPWVERYVNLLWLSHLLLAPFPLDSISGCQSSLQKPTCINFHLSSQVPVVAKRVLSVCMERLGSASKERSAAAVLLARLCMRPDMQKIGLHKSVIQWSIAFFEGVSDSQVDIHKCLGVLSFLSEVVSSATKEEIVSFIQAIHECCRAIIDQAKLVLVLSSAVARKLLTKILRYIAIHCLKVTSNSQGFDPNSIIEDIIGFLLETLADGDSPVRYGASKALSIIALRLDSEMANEVILAILESLTDDVYWQNNKRNLNSVNALRWHGLTLTLSQLLYRKAIPTNHLPKVLNALLLSLGFEHRSPTGGSIGTNVRDAACFGIWALSRRYTTTDLVLVDTASIQASGYKKVLSVPQVLATELVVAACLDPAGNIRRGSSAALQELVGRHPNTVEEGIPLVQVIDFHAVGLRSRSVCDVAIQAATLNSMYWEALFENLLGWRGTGSLDSDSRLTAADAIGLLTKNQPLSVVLWMSKEISDKLRELRPRQVEERQGLASALAALVKMTGLSKKYDHEMMQKLLFQLWGLLETDLQLEEKAFSSSALRPEFTASSFCKFLGAMATLTNELDQNYWPANIPVAEVACVLNLCLIRHEDTVLQAISSATKPLLRLLSACPGANVDAMVSAWLTKLENEASYNGLRCSGHMIALGAAFTLDNQDNDSTRTALKDRIINVLTFRCTSGVAIEARIIALRAISIVLANSSTARPKTLTFDVEARLGAALHGALNDYTITERGDIGSLVRLEALDTVSIARDHGYFHDQGTIPNDGIYADVIRLSLEKLDKIRVRAAQLSHKYPSAEENTTPHTATDIDVSSRAYFAKALSMLQLSGNSSFGESVCSGFVSSAGMGSESVIHASRAALVDYVEALPNMCVSDIQQFTLLDFVTSVADLLKRNLENDRVLLPVLEVIAFLFDMQAMQRLRNTSFR